MPNFADTRAAAQRAGIFYRGSVDSAPLTYAEDIRTRISAPDGDNDLDSVLASIRGAGIDTFTALPDVEGLPEGKTIYLRGGEFYRIGGVASVDGDFFAGLRYGVKGYTRGDTGAFPADVGRAVHNPLGRIWFLVGHPVENPTLNTLGQRQVSIGIENSRVVALLGRAATTSDKLTLRITSVTASTNTANVTVTFDEVLSFSDPDHSPDTATIAIFRSEEMSETIFDTLPDDNAFTVDVFTGTTTGTAFFPASTSKSWTPINGEIFRSILDRLGEVEGQGLKDQGLPLPDPEQYGENDIIVSDEEWYRLGRTDTDVANLFLASVGHDTFRTAGSEEWRGVATSQSPNGFSTDGGFSVNPDNSLSLVMASNEGRLRVGIRKSVFDAAKGSAFATSDKVAMKITYPDDSTDEAVLAYFNSYIRILGGADTSYLLFQHRDTDNNYNLYTADDGALIDIEFFTVGSDGNATTTAFLTHPVALKHWIHWNVQAAPSNTGTGKDAVARAKLAPLATYSHPWRTLTTATLPQGTRILQHTGTVSFNLNSGWTEVTDFTPPTPSTSSPVVYVFEVNANDDHHYRSLFEWYGEHDEFENYSYDISSTLSNKVQGKKYLFKQARIVTASLHHEMSNFRLQAQLQEVTDDYSAIIKAPVDEATIGFATSLPRRSDDGAVLQNETVNVTFPGVTVDTGFDLRGLADGPCIVHLRTPDGRDWQRQTSKAQLTALAGEATSASSGSDGYDFKTVAGARQRSYRLGRLSSHNLWIGSEQTGNHIVSVMSEAGMGMVAPVRLMANQAAYDALSTKHAGTIYFVNASSLGSRRVYFGSVRFT